MREVEMSLTGHLAQLRGATIRILVATGITFAVAWTFHEHVFRLLAAPVMRGLEPHNIKTLQALHVTESIVVQIKACAVAAILTASPFIIWQIWRFIAPALNLKERRTIAATGALVATFFALGVAFAWAVFIPLVVEFLAGFGLADEALVLAPTLNSTFSMAMGFMLAFGLIFQLPLVMMVLGMLRAIKPEAMLKKSRWFIVGAFIVSAIFTPPDPVSQTLMAIPMCVLYLLGVLLAHFGWKMGGIRLWMDSDRL